MTESMQPGAAPAPVPGPVPNPETLVNAPNPLSQNPLPETTLPPLTDTAPSAATNTMYGSPAMPIENNSFTPPVKKNSWLPVVFIAAIFFIVCAILVVMGVVYFSTSKNNSGDQTTDNNVSTTPVKVSGLEFSGQQIVDALQPSYEAIASVNDLEESAIYIATDNDMPVVFVYSGPGEGNAGIEEALVSSSYKGTGVLDTMVDDSGKSSFLSSIKDIVLVARVAPTVFSDGDTLTLTDYYKSDSVYLSYYYVPSASAARDAYAGILYYDHANKEYKGYFQTKVADLVADKTVASYRFEAVTNDHLIAVGSSCLMCTDASYNTFVINFTAKNYFVISGLTANEKFDLNKGTLTITHLEKVQLDSDNCSDANCYSYGEGATEAYILP